MTLTTEEIKQILEGAPEGWTHYCTRNRQYFRRHCNTKSISLWIRVNEEWSMTLESKMRWLERRERLEEILTLRQRVEELERDWNLEHYYRRAADEENEIFKAQQSEVAARAVEGFADKVIRKHTRTIGQAGASGPFGVVEVDYIKTERDNYANQLRE